jgi:hypothetical protein
MFLPLSSTLHPLAMKVLGKASPFSTKCLADDLMVGLFAFVYKGLNFATGLEELLIFFRD